MQMYNLYITNKQNIYKTARNNLTNKSNLARASLIEGKFSNQLAVAVGSGSWQWQYSVAVGSLNA
jgi:hypothetical protein